MENIIVIALLLIAVALAARSAVRRARRGGGCCGEREAAPARRRAADRHKAHYPYEVTLRIGGMTCENCARRVENALNGLEGTWAKVDIGSHTAVIRCKTAPDPEKLRAAVREAGYVPLA